MNENTPSLDLPKEIFQPVIEQPMELERLYGQELLLCYQDLDGPHQFTTCYGDICKIVNALRDYSRLLEMACNQWNLTGFHRATYECHAEKLRQIAGKMQAGIGYDYDKAVETCKKKRARKSAASDVGEDAMTLAVRASSSTDKKKQEAKSQNEPLEDSLEGDSLWESEDE